MLKLQPSKNILVLISGSIAAYKTCFVISKLVQGRHQVQVVTTPQALNFIGPSTLEGLTGKPVLSETFAPHHAMDHIHLARWADLILLCPATANTINKMSQGIADDLVTNLFLAHDFKKPFIVAPAMNSAMYQHPCTQTSLEQLQKMGVKILKPGEGSLACGEIGSGRMMEPEAILAELEKSLSQLNDNPASIETQKNSAALFHSDNETSPIAASSFATRATLTPEASVTIGTPPKILITSGGTQEPIDAMRVLTNLSTGQTGAFLAEAFWDQGYEVHYLGASHAIKPQRPCAMTSFATFNDLNEKLKSLLQTHHYHAVIHAAAVSDFSVSKVFSATAEYKDSSVNLKIPSHEKITIELEPNFKILPLLKSYAQKGEASTRLKAEPQKGEPIKTNTLDKVVSSPGTMDLPLIIGFKFTATRNPIERAKAVDKLFSEGGIDFVVHNDQNDIDKSKGLHTFTLHSSSEKILLPNPLSLADALIEKVFQSQSKKKGSAL